MASAARWISLAACGLLAASACGPDPAKAPAAAASVPGGPAPSVTVDLGRRVTMKFLLVPAGSFQMGSTDGPDEERPVHEVTFAQPYYLAATEVTQEQWETVMGALPPGGTHFKGDDQLPVERVTWDECQQFVAKLDAKAGGAQFVIPSEAQWEYACRAGSKTWWCEGDNETGLGNYAVYCVNSGINGPVRTHPVGGRKPNAWGFFDLHGNVSEFCADSWHPDYRGAPADGSAWDPRDAAPHVIRGGSYSDSWRVVHSAWRDRVDPDRRLSTVGFRPARLVSAR